MLLYGGLAAAFFDFGLNMATAAADLNLMDLNPLAMPEIGSCGLRILSPTLLELTLITTKSPDPARVSGWDFVGANYQFTAPPLDEFSVTVDGQHVAVQQAGFKRRPLFAPLKTRDLRIASCVYLQLGGAIADRQKVEVTNPSGHLWTAADHFAATADPQRWNPALHVNQVGYLPTFPKKGMVGYYLGSLGEMTVPTASGFQVIDSSGSVVFQGQLTRRVDQGYTYTPAPYQQVWEADFTALTTPGEYRLFVPGVGTSYPFLINEGIAANFARAFALGIFHQRCGMKEDFPFTRHVHDVCHAGLVQVPDASFTAVNRELANMSSDFANYQTARQLKDVDSSLYPFVNHASREMTGGHHDAGDYSKYTINSAGFVHYLVFAADAFPGAGNLDNLGIPESGDGKSDILQEAKWEADFLAKMQDADGGFYFLVYPRDREYENDVLPDKGDPQVVFPKTTAVTAAAVAALAEAGSSPLFRAQFPSEAAAYLEKARLGWRFLQHAIARYGKAGSYQKITHYGNEFTHDDELAWAACALFVATGDPSYHQQLKAWYDPADPNTRRWSWWRLFEGYGCAARSYAFAARSGRLPSSALDPVYLAKCEAEIRAAANDQLHFADESAYGTSFSDQNKSYRSAGWYFSSERAFDLTVAYQLSPRAEYREAVVSNWNFEGGCNPLNMTYITGIGSRRQREIVSQYAENDRRVLPPSGIPLGNVQASYQYLYSYGGDLEAMTFPSDGATTAPYPFYDRWCDTFNTTTEFVITDQARSLASLSFWMAQTPLQGQSWRSAPGQITGLPSQIPAKQPVSATLVVPGLDLTGARVVWEARDQEPRFGNPVTFAASSAGPQWVEAEAQLPDGRRVFGATNFLATTPLDTPPNGFESAELSVTPDMVALFHLDGGLADATGHYGSLTLAGNAQLDNSNLGWMTDRTGSALQFGDLGDKAAIDIPNSALRSGSGTTAIILEAMVYVDSFVAFNRDLAVIVSLHDSWNAFLEFGEDKYAGPYVRGGTQMELLGQALLNVLTLKQWHHLSIEVNQGGYVLRIDGKMVASAPSNELANWGGESTTRIELGNFSGWIDEVVVRSVRNGAPPNQPPTVSLTGPQDGAVLSAPVNLTLTANAADTDGSLARVEFYSGTTKIGQVGGGAYPYSFVWFGVPAGSYSLTAKAIDNQGATATSAAVLVTVNSPQQAVADPVITPSGGNHTGSVTVSLATETSGATIRYTLDGTEPNASSPIYTAPFTLTGTSTVKAKGFRSGFAESGVASTTFTVTASADSGTRVTFLPFDSGIQGTWKGALGGEGYLVLGNSAAIPGYAQVSSSGNADYVWSDTTQDVRALQKASGNDRIAGCWYSSTAFKIDLSFTDAKAHRVAIYCLDWDGLGRAQQIDVLDAVSGAVLDSRILADFQPGKYLVWDVAGQVKLRVTRLSGPNAVVMGLFFDRDASQSNDLPIPALLSWSASSRPISIDGCRVHLTGQPGQRYVFEASTDLVNWVALSTNTLTGSELDLVDYSAAAATVKFYRTRSLGSPQAQYTIEASSDLLHWSAIGTSRSTNDLSGFRSQDSGLHAVRFYRAVPAVPAQAVQSIQP